LDQIRSIETIQTICTHNAWLCGSDAAIRLQVEKSKTCILAQE